MLFCRRLQQQIIVRVDGGTSGAVKSSSLVVGLAAKHRSGSQFSASPQAQPANPCKVSELLLSILYYRQQQKTKKS